jgi:branched-chain amino acid transport system ATP-binding protein
VTGLRLLNVESGSWRRPISLELREAEAVLLLGRNGAGKTTLLNTIAGLLPTLAGSISFQGSDVTHLDELGRTARGIRIALEGHQVFSRLSVRRNLLLGAFGCYSARNTHANLEWVLEVFPDLRGKLEQPAGTLSGGQQTLVNVGRALMGNPRVLMLDEPALGLDPQNAGKLIRVLRQVRGERGITTLIAEQGGAFARAFPERVVLLVGGEIAFDGPWAQAKNEGLLGTVLG